MEASSILINKPAPELVGITGYINSSEDLTLESLSGKVILLQIWTFGCINCTRTLPYVRKWYEKYGGDDFTIIGVHTPEFDFERKRENVLKAVQEHKIEYPVVMDNSMETWRAYNNRWWPHLFLIDRQGIIRYHWIGEGQYSETEVQITSYIGEKKE